MSISPDEARELAATFPGTERAEEAGVTYFRIPDVTLPDDCSPSPMTLLLCPSQLGGYQYRLFFAEQVKTPQRRTGTAVFISSARRGTPSPGRRRRRSLSPRWWRAC